MIKNQKRKVGLAALSALTLSCAVTAGVFAGNKVTKVKAAGEQTFAMVDGASVRLDTEQYGLRFSAEIGSAYTENANVSYHMMIVPVKWIEKYGLSGADFNGDYMTTLQSALKAEAEAGKGLGEDGKTQRTIATVDCTPKYIEKATSDYKANTWYISGSLTSIKYGNLNGDFFGLAYQLDNKGTAEDASDDSYTYATFVAGENERNAVYVASAAYQNGEFSEDSAEQGVLFKLVNQGLHSANGDDESAKDTTYAFNPTLESEKYIIKGTSYQMTVGGIPAKAKLKAVWKSADPSVATVDENGLVTAGDKAGKTSVSCEVFGKTISCLVEVGDRKTETKELGDYVLNSMSFSGRDFVQEGIVGEVSGVTIGKTALESTAYSYAEGKLTIPYITIKDYYGINKTITVATEDADYIYKANIVTLSITDKSQFIPVDDDNNTATAPLNALQTAGGLTGEKFGANGMAANTYTDYFGYFVLENDIDFEGETISVSSGNKSKNGVARVGLNGLFEGNGHTLTNFTIGKTNNGSLFGGVSLDATVQNVKIVDVTVSKGSQGIFGYNWSGTFNNVMVIAEGVTEKTLGGFGQYEVNMSNCIFVVNALDTATGNLLSGGTIGTLNATNATVFTNKNANTMWAVTKVNSDIAVKGYTAVNVNAGEDVSLTFEKAAEVWLDGDNITAEAEITDSNVKIDKDKIAFSASKRVIVKNATNAEVFQVSVSVTEVNEAKEFSLYNTQKDSTTGEVTWSAKAFEYAIEGTPVTATIDGENASRFLSGGKFVLPVEDVPSYYGKKTVYIETTTHKYTINVTFATLYITDAYQLMQYQNHFSVIQYIGGLTREKYGDGKNQYNEGTTTLNKLIADSRYYGYFVLANDIDFGGAEISINTIEKAGTGVAGRECGFTGTFDGNGHTLSNFTVKGAYSFFGSVSKKTTIKNLNFEKVTIAANSLGIMGYGGGTWSNVFFNVTSANTSVFGDVTSDVVTFTDCVFVVKAEEKLTKNVIFGQVQYAKCVTLTNVTVITNVTATPFAGVSGANPGTTCTKNGFTNVNVYTATFATGDISYEENQEVYLDGVKLAKDTDYTVENGVVTLLKATAGAHTVSVVSATTENATTKVNEGTATVYTVTVA